MKIAPARCKNKESRLFTSFIIEQQPIISETFIHPETSGASIILNVFIHLLKSLSFVFGLSSFASNFCVFTIGAFTHLRIFF